MVCPKCGNVLSDGSNGCPSCGTVFSNANYQSMPPMGGGNEIFVPQDFKLAGESDDFNQNDLPDAMINVLNGGNEKEKKTEEKKKKKKGSAKKLIKFIIILILLGGLGFLGYNLYLGYTSPKYDLICNYSSAIAENVMMDATFEYSLSDNKKYINSHEKYVIYNQNNKPMTYADLGLYDSNFGAGSYNYNSILEDGKVVITYYVSCYDIKTLSELKQFATNNNYSCEKPEVKGIVLPFFN